MNTIVCFYPLPSTERLLTHHPLTHPPLPPPPPCLPLTDPPENVLINAPSDKLNLVEGTNGPRLSCQASGEPQVQYRWLLLKSNNLISSSDLVALRYNLKHFPTAVNAAIANNNNNDHQRQRPNAIHQQSSKTLESTASLTHSPTVSANDVAVDGAANGSSEEQSRLVELTGSASEQVGVHGTSISTLDMSNISIDRKQSGHYICEASNRLGQTRQSVYVNVLCK